MNPGNRTLIMFFTEKRNYFVNYIFWEKKGNTHQKGYFSLSQQTGEQIERDKRKNICFFDKIISLKTSR